MNLEMLRTPKFVDGLCQHSCYISESREIFNFWNAN